jgi:hypothetical protein
MVSVVRELLSSERPRLQQPHSRQTQPVSLRDLALMLRVAPGAAQPHREKAWVSMIQRREEWEQRLEVGKIWKFERGSCLVEP